MKDGLARKLAYSLESIVKRINSANKKGVFHLRKQSDLKNDVKKILQAGAFRLIGHRSGGTNRCVLCETHGLHRIHNEYYNPLFFKNYPSLSMCVERKANYESPLEFSVCDSCLELYMKD